MYLYISKTVKYGLCRCTCMFLKVCIDLQLSKRLFSQFSSLFYSFPRLFTTLSYLSELFFCFHHFSLFFIVFLQRCAVRSQDFAIFHREYIGFENPYPIRMLVIRILHPHWYGLNSYSKAGQESECHKNYNVRAKINCNN